MITKSQAWRPRRRLRRHTYYKVQFFDPIIQSWRDEKPGFDKIDEAKAHIIRHLAEKRARIMVVEGDKRNPLDEEAD